MYKELVKLKDLRVNLEKYLARLSKTGGFTVVRRSEPLFDVTPVEGARGEVWEEVIDFTRLKQGGVNIKEILARL